MYSIFLVEDEIVVREGIRNSIPWADTPYVLAGEAPDGEMALSLMKDIKPDILITDIKMPFMDGLELTRLIRKTQPWVKIIIISGHDEFSYAKKAISLGVEDYLLKPVSSVDMLKSLEKVSNKIAEEKRQRLSYENLCVQVRNTAGILRGKWLCELVGGGVDAGEAVERGRSFDLDLIARGYIVLVASLEVEASKYTEFAGAALIVETIVSTRDDLIFFSTSMDTLVIICKQVNAESLEETVYALGGAIKHEVERDTLCRVSVGIGRLVTHIAEIASSFADAQKALAQLAQAGRRVIAGIGDIEVLNENDLMRLDGDPVADRLRSAKRSDIDALVEHFMELLGDKPIHSSLLGYYLLGDIIVASAKLIESLGGKLQDVYPSILIQENMMDVVSSPERFRLEVRTLLDAIITYRESVVTGRYAPMIQKAKKYIETHFASQDISLHSVSEEVNVSPNHFSTLFSQETGVTFIEYLTRVRIENAKMLLSTTAMRSAEIAYESGFGDPHYFSFIFKKNTGMSPTEFRSAFTVSGQ